MSTAKVALFTPAQEFIKSVVDNPDAMARLKVPQDKIGSALQELAKEADEAHAPIWATDKWLYRFAVLVLGSLALIAAIGAVVLVMFNQHTPEVLISLGSAAVGALVGLFAPSPIAKEGSK